MSRLRMSRSRLAKLSYTQLLNSAVEACEGSPKLKNKAAHRAHGRDQARKRAKFTSGEE